MEFTEKPVTQSGNGLICAEDVVAFRTESRAQPGIQPEWPLSFAQQRLWFLEQLEPGKAAYNMPLVARLTGMFNLFAFRRALDAMVNRHESLRTRFICINGCPAQVIDSDCRLKLRVEDLAPLTLAERKTEIKRRIRDEINHPFDLGEGPLIRVLVLRLAEEQHILVLTMHHIVSDEWSLNIFIRELGAYYEGFVAGQEVAMPELPIQYADFAVWQREWLTGQVLEEQIGFWRERLKGNPPVLELPTDFSRRQLIQSQGQTLTRLLSQEMEASLRALAKREEASLFMVLIAAFNTLLYRYTQQEDIVISSPMAGRNRLELEGLDWLLREYFATPNKSFGQSLIHYSFAPGSGSHTGGVFPSGRAFRKNCRRASSRKDRFRNALCQSVIHAAKHFL